jgi:formate/nitrite transporter FocA (FNT family)
MNRLRSQKQTPVADAPSEASKPRSTRLSAGQIYDNIRVSAQEEMRRPAAALFWSATAAGLTIGFSFLAGAYLTALAAAAYSGAATAVGYPLGFVFVVLARGQLFTENTLEPIIPLLHSPTLKTLRQLLSLWVVVLIGNLVGACMFAAIVALTPMLGETLRPTLIAVARTGTDGGFWLVALRAIYAGWLIALMAWLIASTRATGAGALNLAHHRAYFGARVPSLGSRAGGGVLPRLRTHGGLARDGRGLFAACRGGEHRRRICFCRAAESWTGCGGPRRRCGDARWVSVRRLAPLSARGLSPGYGLMTAGKL